MIAASFFILRAEFSVASVPVCAKNRRMVSEIVKIRENAFWRIFTNIPDRNTLSFFVIFCAVQSRSASDQRRRKRRLFENKNLHRLREVL